jgi:hypothetical protein
MFQSISVKSAELIVARLTEINESGRLDKRWIDPVGSILLDMERQLFLV